MAVRGAQTALRAISLIEAIARSDKPLTVADLARSSQINSSAVYRLVRALLENDLLARDPSGQGVLVGNSLITLASQIMRKSTFRELARPVIESLAASTSETVTLHVRDGRHRICIDGIESPHPIRRAAFIGQSVPIYLGPTGKAILAFLSQSEIDEIVHWAGQEGADKKLLQSQLKVVKDKGYAAFLNDRSQGTSGLSAPIFNGPNAVGAITISGPVDRFTADGMEATAGALVAGCAGLNWQSAAPVSGPR